MLMKSVVSKGIEESYKKELEDLVIADLSVELGLGGERSDRLIRKIENQSNHIDSVTADLDNVTRLQESYINDVDPINPVISKTALESLNAITNVIGRKTGVSFNDEMNRVTTEAYASDYVSNRISHRITLEGMSEIVSKTYDYLVTAMNKLWKWVKELLRENFSRNGSVKTRLERLLKKLRKMDNWPVKSGVDMPPGSDVTKVFTVGSNVIECGNIIKLTDRFADFVKLKDDVLVELVKYFSKLTTIVNRNGDDMKANNTDVGNTLKRMVGLYKDTNMVGGEELERRLPTGIYGHVVEVENKLPTVTFSKPLLADKANPVVVSSSKEDCIKLLLVGLELNVSVYDLSKTIEPLEKDTGDFIRNFKKQAKDIDDSALKDFTSFSREVTAVIRSIVRTSAKMVTVGNATSAACGSVVVLHLKNGSN